MTSISIARLIRMRAVQDPSHLPEPFIHQLLYSSLYPSGLNMPLNFLVRNPTKNQSIIKPLFRPVAVDGGHNDLTRLMRDSGGEQDTKGGEDELKARRVGECDKRCIRLSALK